MKFVDVTSAPDGSLVADTFMPGTTGDNTALVYTGGSMASIDGNDTITVQDNDLQATLAAGGFINGGAGVDTLMLAAGTNLNLETLATNQTVKPIQEVEVFQMQGGSTLTLSANDVLSLGGNNTGNGTGTMAAYNFTSTTQTAFGTVSATGTTSSTGKVQLVINGTNTDVVALDGLNLDGVTTNGTVGNSGLAGQWDYKGTTDITVGGVTTTYRVYNHSTTSAQLLVDSDVGSSTSGNAVAITNVQASGETTKVLMETFDNLPYKSTESMWDFTTANGIQFQSQFGGSILPTFTQVNDRLVINNATLPSTNTSQWAIMPWNGTIENATFDYNGINNSTASGTAVVRLYNNSALAAGPLNLANNALPSDPATFNQSGAFDEISFQNMPKDQYAIDDLKLTMTGVAETVDLANGSGTRHTTGVVSGTLAKALSAGEYIEVFSNGVSLGQAAVNGTTWSIADTIAAGGENYTAKIMSSSAAEVASSMNYAINQAGGAVPRLTITNDASEPVSAGKTVNYTFRFDQAVTGFDASDVTVTNGGTVSGLIKLDDQTWVMSVNAPSTGAGTTTVSVADGSYNATNGGAAGLGASDSHAFDAALTPYSFDGYKGSNTGSAAIDPLYTGAGDDWVTAVGTKNTGVEYINTGAGSDTIQIMGNNLTKLALAAGFAEFDGGDGIDRLGFYNGGTVAANITLDLTNVNVANHLHNFETIDMTQNGAGGTGTLKLDRNAIINLSDLLDNTATSGVDESQMLVVNGKAGDKVQLVGGANWTNVATGLTGELLNSTYGADYKFTSTDRYTQMSNNGVTLFLDDDLTRSNL
ncbi:Ig-like domain-containing protein [Limnohabitans sp. Bal53]|uniref:beta strand repeat-containing protein n=1 Tax=Limnohabitans sp. Bal53 TaxID=1977910 RepID=UPI0011B29769|nr:Ig-like domain-containing protein [Limnohabitans sp. Bal53]